MESLRCSWNAAVGWARRQTQVSTRGGGKRRGAATQAHSRTPLRSARALELGRADALTCIHALPRSLSLPLSLSIHKHAFERGVPPHALERTPRPAPSARAHARARTWDEHRFPTSRPAPPRPSLPCRGQRALWSRAPRPPARATHSDALALTITPKQALGIACILIRAVSPLVFGHPRRRLLASRGRGRARPPHSAAAQLPRPGGGAGRGCCGRAGLLRPHLAPTHGRRRGWARGKEGARAAAVAANGRSESWG